MKAAATRVLPAIDKRAVLVLVVALALLLAPWPSLGRAFATIFAGYGNAVVTGLGLGGEAKPRFSVPPRGRATAEDGGDWAVALAPEATTDGADGMLLDTRFLGYTPVAVLLAIAAASRLPRRRRLLVFAFATGCLLARAAVAIALPVARAFEGAAAGWARGPLAEVVWFDLVMPPVMSYATPLLAWWIGFSLTTAPEASSARGRAPRDRGRRHK